MPMGQPLAPRAEPAVSIQMNLLGAQCLTKCSPPGSSTSVLFFVRRKKEDRALWLWMTSSMLCDLREKPETKPGLDEMPVTGQDIR
jgi:hypothetical protein